MRRNRHSQNLLILPAIAVLFAGCGLSVGDRTLEEIVEQTYKVDATATLSLSNTDGSVRIYGTDTTEIKLQAIKKAYSAERLSQILVNVSAQSGSVSIETKYPAKKTWGLADRSGTVDYTLVVPRTCKISKLDLENGEILIDGMRGEAVQANLVNGRLYAHNCFSDAHLSVITGGLDVSYNWWEQRKFSIDAQIVNGHTHLFIPGDASFHVVAETEDGQIDNAFAEQAQRNGDDVSKIDVVIGTTPGAEFRLRAKNGNIQIGEADVQN
jgi:Putative adhesin